MTSSGLNLVSTKNLELVLLHGFWGQPEDWSAVQKEIAKLNPQITFWAPSLKNDEGLGPELGFSGWSEKLNDMALVRAKDRKRVLVGYSMGGRLAIHAALSRPQNWEALILISSHHGQLSTDEIKDRKKWEEEWSQNFLSRPLTELSAIWNSQAVFSGHNQEKASSYSGAELSQALKNWSVCEHIFKLQDLRNFHKPILWQVGSKDHKYVDLAEGLDGFGSNLKKDIIKDSGHRVLIEQPKPCAKSICEFLNQMGN